ncbi:MAG: serine/threonine-protein kinase, partial [Planctomycetota bacterium]
ADIFIAPVAHARESTGSRPPTWTPPLPSALAPLFPELEIQALIGQGGMGAVYRVREKNRDRQAALKILRPEEAGSPDFAERFAREAQALKRLNHPNIVTIYDSGRSGTWCWLLMELVEGANLRQVLAVGALSPAQTLALVSPLCAALQFAHDAGIVHRDIKPENIILDANGQPKIADFGLAKLQTGVGSGSLTGTGAVLGTIHYMAPEQVANSKDVDHRADIYGLGVVIYELLTGCLPLGRFEPPSHRAGVDARMDDVVFKALERDPARRWQQASEVQHAVEQAADGVSLVKPAASTSAFGFHGVVAVGCACFAIVLIFISYVRGSSFIWATCTGLLPSGLAWVLTILHARQNRRLIITVSGSVFVIGMCIVFGILYFLAWQKWVGGQRADGELTVPLPLPEGIQHEAAQTNWTFWKVADGSWCWAIPPHRVVIIGVSPTIAGSLSNKELGVTVEGQTGLHVPLQDNTVQLVTAQGIQQKQIGNHYDELVEWIQAQHRQGKSLDVRRWNSLKFEFE